MDDIAIRQVCGVVPTSDEFIALVNEVEESLAIRGGWFDLEQRIRFCLTGCSIVWPYFVGTILGVRFCGGLASMQNQWYSFVNNSMGAYQNSAYGLAGGYGASYDGGYGGGSDAYRYGNGGCVIEDDSTRSCHNEITGTTGKQIRYNVVKQQDIGKKITIFGRKYGAQPLQELDNSAWVNGVTITAASPFGEAISISNNLVPSGAAYNDGDTYTLTGLTAGLTYTLTMGVNELSSVNGGSGLMLGNGTFTSYDGTVIFSEKGPGHFKPVTASVKMLTALVTEIDAITREETEGMAYLYEYDPATGKQRDLAVFQPWETNPRYRCSRIMNRPAGKLDANGVCWTSVEALVKLKFIPVKHARDFLPLSNFRALKLGIQAVNLEQQNDSVNAQIKWNLAVAELQREQEFLQPKKQVPIRVNLGRSIFSPI